MSAVTALIVDDEPLARERIRTLLATFPEVAIVGEARDANEAVAKIRELGTVVACFDNETTHVNRLKQAFPEQEMQETERS